MADIKTRDVRRGEIRALDRPGAMTHRMKNVAVRAKENTVNDRRGDESSSSSFAIDKSLRSGLEAAYNSARVGERVAITAVDSAKREYAKKSSVKRIREAEIRSEAASVGDSSRIKVDFGDSSRISANLGDYSRKSATFGDSKQIRNNRSNLKTRSIGRRSQFLPGHSVYNEFPEARKIAKANVTTNRKIEKIRKGQFARKRAAVMATKGTKRTLKAVLQGIKGAAIAVKSMYMALVTAGASAVAIVVICTLFASSLYLFGSDSNDEYSAEALGVGDTLIMRVASAQLGNVGGRKFWSWYGFEGRVEWCAIFVSWCGNQCGYIEQGIIPRFALVSDGVNWFKARRRFQGNRYIPHPGDVIFFDWGADGTQDHVGFVERCDGNTVYTIEGNSGDACRRLAYRVGSPVVLGYGVPAYPLPRGGAKSNKSEAENEAKNRINNSSEGF